MKDKEKYIKLGMEMKDVKNTINNVIDFLYYSSFWKRLVWLFTGKI